MGRDCRGDDQQSGQDRPGQMFVKSQAQMANKAAHQVLQKDGNRSHADLALATRAAKHLRIEGEVEKLDSGGWSTLVVVLGR